MTLAQIEGARKLETYECPRAAWRANGEIRVMESHPPGQSGHGDMPAK
jgi:hypothetical protein